VRQLAAIFSVSDRLIANRLTDFFCLTGNISSVDVLLKMALMCGWLFVFAIVPFAFVSAANKRTLVLLDNWTIRETHSIFFKTLRGKTEHAFAGFTLKCGRPAETVNYFL